MPDTLLTLVSDEFEMFKRLRHQHPQLFPEPNRAPHLYPVPFFGDIRRARILTMALNPSWKEFHPARQWLANLDAPALTTRLLYYFDLPFPECHPWFAELEKSLLYLGCSYESDAAHIDVHPFPTKFSADLGPEERSVLQGIIQQRSAEHLGAVLSLAKQLKMIVVVDYSVPVAGGGGLQTFDYVRTQLPSLATVIDLSGIEPPVIRGGSHQDVANLLFKRRRRLRDYLRTAPHLA